MAAPAKVISLEVRLSEDGATVGTFLHVFLAVAFVLALVAPGFAWPPYFRILMTVLFLLLALLVVRAYAVAFVSFRHPKDPPEKPDDLEWPTVSVLVPAYNEESVLPRTIESMQQLDYPQDRLQFVYVYEKRGTDRTGEIIRDFAARDARVVAAERDEPTGGKAAAANHGILRCTGELVFLLDADHALRPDAIQRAARNFLADERIMCVKGRCLSVNGDESAIALMAKMERDIIEKGDLYVRHLWRAFSFFGGGQACFRREVFDRLGLFDEEILVEDVDFSIRIHEAGYGLVVDPEVQSFEEHPATLRAWWAQRKRWARGWMQVATRYLARLRSMKKLSWRERVDLYITLAYTLVPLFFVIGLPLAFLGAVVAPAMGAVIDARDYFAPWSYIAWTAFALAPALAWIAMWAQDRRDGIRHKRREWIGVPFLWPYLVFQTATFWSALLDEFVLRRPSVFVKTSKTGRAAVAGRSVPAAARAATEPGPRR